MSLHHSIKRALNARFRSGSAYTQIFLAIEFLDEFFGGAWLVALPLLQTRLQLSYTEIGLLSTIPNLVNTLFEPALGILGGLGYRKKLILGGGVTFSLSIGLIALSQHWWTLLLGFVLLHPASGAFVSLSQATLMDSDPTRHEQNMARWGVAGSLGTFGGSLAVSTLVWLGRDWRLALGASALLALGLVKLLWQRPFPLVIATDDSSRQSLSVWQGLQKVLRSLRCGAVLRWLILLELSDLMLDVFTTLLPLYLVSIAQINEVQAGLATTGCVSIGLVGDCLLIPLLERVQSLRYLRLSVLSTLFLFPIFLLTPTPVKLVLLIPLSLCRTGWYPILKGQLYSAMPPGQSSAVMTLSTIVGQLTGLLPVGLGLIADHYGLDVTMWLLLIAPIALLIGA